VTGKRKIFLKIKIISRDEKGIEKNKKTYFVPIQGPNGKGPKN
jgi:hypothetical protein